MTSVKDTIKNLEGTDADFAALLEQEQEGENRKTLIKWLDSQIKPVVPFEGVGLAASAEDGSPIETGAPETTGPVDVSVPVETAYVRPVNYGSQVDTIEGGAIPINELIATLGTKRDRWQRSTSAGLENIFAHVSDIKITVR